MYGDKILLRIGLSVLVLAGAAGLIVTIKNQGKKEFNREVLKDSKRLNSVLNLKLNTATRQDNAQALAQHKEVDALWPNESDQYSQCFWSCPFRAVLRKAE